MSEGQALGVTITWWCIEYAGPAGHVPGTMPLYNIDYHSRLEGDKFSNTYASRACQDAKPAPELEIGVSGGCRFVFSTGS